MASCMTLETSIDQLVCKFCKSEADTGDYAPPVDYLIRDVTVERQDGTKVTVPIDITECDIDYKRGSPFPVRILARVPCASCGTDHTIDARDILKVPRIALAETECPDCGHLLAIVDGPKLRYVEKTPGDGWAEVWAIAECPQCKFKSPGYAAVTAAAFQSAQASGTLAVKVSMPSSETSQKVSTVPLSKSIQENPFGLFPMLSWAKNVLGDELATPFAGLRVVFILHFLTDLLPFAKACVELGLDPKQAMFLFKSEYRYPHIDSVREWLHAEGFETRPVGEAAAYVEELASAWTPNDPPILIVEDGGYLAPLLHERKSPLLAHVIGAVEQTTKGLRKTEDWGKTQTADKNLHGTLQFPLISIPDSTIKTRIEPPLIGNEVVQCIQQLTTFSLQGAHVALLGLGTIGMEVFLRLKSANAIVTGFDAADDSRKSQFSMAGGTLAGTAVEAVRRKRLVIGCSGRPSVTSDVLENLDNGAFVVSASSDLVEIDLKYLEHRKVGKARFGIKDADVVPGQMWGGTRFELAGYPRREVNLLADGYPVTFWGAAGMPHEGGDLIMTVILFAAAQLAARNGPQAKAASSLPYPNEICRHAVDQLGDKYQLTGQHLKLYRPQG